MFRKFTLEDISTQNQVKSSIQRGIRGEICASCFIEAACSDHHGEQRSENNTPVRAAKICASYPILEVTGAIEQILPKKEQALLAKL